MKLSDFIRDVPDFPKKGIIFKDITPLLKNAGAFAGMIDELANIYKGKKIDKIAAIESRGFIIGAALALRMGCGFVPVRKKGKLPYRTIKQKYQLEYGTDILEIHKDAVKKNENVLIVDDVLATGGTARAVCELIGKLKGNIVGLCFLIELKFLKGKDKLKKHKVNSLIEY